MALYALIDRDSLLQRGVLLDRFIARIATLNPSIVQYRAKNATTAQRIEALQTIRQHYNGTTIINDDIEAIAYADGIHIGQEDFAQFAPDKPQAIEYIKTQIGEKLLGLSTHNMDEVLEANALDLDYIGLGAYRPTSTKKEAQVGERLLEVAAHSRHPVGLIGGVRLDDVFDSSVIAYRVVGSDLFGRV